jgi:hypothetical protein
MVGVLVTVSTLVRMVVLGFALGVIVGYFGIGGSDDSATCAERPAACAPAPDTSAPVNPEAAPK